MIDQNKQLEVSRDNRVSIPRCPLKGNMYDHQRVAWELACTSEKFALLMEQGTGKTMPAIGVIGYRMPKRVLIVAPISVIPFWKQEIARCADFPYGLVDLTGCKTEERDKMLRIVEPIKSGPVIALINYESTWRYYPQLKKWNAQMIICDESQKIKRYRAKQSKAMHLLGDGAKYKLILTGTPVTQSPIDFWSQYRFLDPTIFGDNYFRFRGRYAIMGGWQRKQIVGYRHLPELAEKAHSIAYRVKKEDCLTLPPQVDQTLLIELNPLARAKYKELKREFSTMLESGNTVTVPIVLTQLLRLQQITGGYVKNDIGEIEQVSNSKMDELKDLLEAMPVDKKVVIFARFIPEVEGIAKISGGLKRHYVTLTGATLDRGSTIEKFQNDPETTVFIAQIQTGSLGITLTAADTVIFYSTTFGYADYEQARARIHRVGQTATSVTYIHLITKNTIDEDILEALREKRDVAQYVVDKLKKEWEDADEETDKERTEICHADG